MGALALIGRSHTLRGLREDARRVRRRARPGPAQPTPGPVTEAPRPADQVASYLDRHDQPKLALGIGDKVIDGWLCTDIAPRHPDVVRLDARRLGPIPDSSIRYVHAEHVIEHMSWPHGQQMLAHCRRVLEPGGVLRIATPDLARLVGAYRGDAGPDGEHYLGWAYDVYCRRYPHRHPGFMLNTVLRAWGHTFVYDRELLLLALADAGFVEVAERRIEQSPHPPLRHMERHHVKRRGRRRAVTFETMVFEATNPGPEPARPTASR